MPPRGAVKHAKHFFCQSISVGEKTPSFLPSVHKLFADIHKPGKQPSLSLLLENKQRAKAGKNLAAKVQKGIKERLVRFGMRNTDQCAPKLSNKQIIEEAAEVDSGVILRHRKETKALLELEEAFLIELGGTPTRGQFASVQGDISSIEVDLTLPEKVKTLKDLSAVRAQRIALERQAFNIKEDAEPDNGTGEDRVWVIKGNRAGQRDGCEA
jgi:hypothetical protein